MAEKIDQPDYRPPLDRFSFMVQRIYAHFIQIGNATFQKWGVDTVTSRIIVALFERESMSAGEITGLMALPQSTISHQIKRLEKLGYVKREIGKEDSRSVIVSLTPEGVKVANIANDLSVEISKELVSFIGEEEEAYIREILHKVDSKLISLRNRPANG